MEENFNPVAQTRANYYTPGSPVQFVCVELLKGDVSGEHAVCLTFKNISRVTLTALEIHFKCKGVDGVILCEDKFEYRDLQVKPGELFGQDDAVFITAKAITSVDVTLCNVYNGKRVVHLDGIKRVRLPAPRRLAPELQKALEARMNRPGLKYQPQVFENGWYCACGAFHPTEEDTVYCSVRNPCDHPYSLSVLYWPSHRSAGAGTVVDGHIIVGSTKYAGELISLPLINSTATKVETVSRMIHGENIVPLMQTAAVCTIALLNPDILFLTGSATLNVREKDIIDYCKQSIPENHMPVFRMQADIHEEYMTGIFSLTRQALKFKH